MQAARCIFYNKITQTIATVNNLDPYLSFKIKDQTKIEGEYLFTIDTASSDPNELDIGWSETPNEHKCYNISKINNGQFVAQPNNRTKWFQPSRSGDLDEIPYFKYSTKVWTCEGFSKWRPSDTEWTY
jgi:hypothetical protein